MSFRILLFATLALLFAACDSSLPESQPELVVEAVFRTGHTPPEILVSETVAPDDPVFRGITGARLSVQIDGIPVPYVTGDRPGVYQPAGDLAPLAPGAEYAVQVEALGQSGTASGRMPPPIRLLEATLDIPRTPVEAVLLDSLSLPLDSLSLQLPSGRAYLYAIGVELRWEDSPGDFWIESRLAPESSFSSRLIDFFLLTQGILPEIDAPLDADRPGLRTWDGVYAIPVDGLDSPLPEHELRVALLRGDESYARFALTSGRPGSREPLGNVSGSLGLVTGVAIDTLRIQVP